MFTYYPGLLWDCRVPWDLGLSVRLLFLHESVLMRVWGTDLPCTAPPFNRPARVHQAMIKNRNRLVAHRKVPVELKDWNDAILSTWTVCQQLRDCLLRWGQLLSEVAALPSLLAGSAAAAATVKLEAVETLAAAERASTAVECVHSRLRPPLRRALDAEAGLLLQATSSFDKTRAYVSALQELVAARVCKRLDSLLLLLQPLDPCARPQLLRADRATVLQCGWLQPRALAGTLGLFGDRVHSSPLTPTFADRSCWGCASVTHLQLA